MTPVEVKAAVRAKLLPRITKEKEAEAIDIVVDFIAGNIGDDFPDWAADLVFQTDGTDDGKNCKHPDTNGKVRLWETKTDDNQGNTPPTDPDVSESTHWKEVSASGSSTQQSIFKTKPVKAASIAALGVAYTEIGGSIPFELEANAAAPFPSIDGVAININEDILLKDEADPTNNGVWRLVTPGVSPIPIVLPFGIKWKLRRRNDALPNGLEGPLIANSFVYVKSPSNSDPAPNQNSGKLFKAWDPYMFHWHEFEHEFVHLFGSPPSLTPGDVVKYNLSKVSAATDDPYAVFVKELVTGYFLFRRSGFLNGVITGMTVGARMYLQSDGTIGTTPTGWLMGHAVKNNSLQLRMQAIVGEHFRGAYDASGAAFPTTGGSGPSGALMPGDEWYVSVAGTLLDGAGDAIYCPVGTLLKRISSSGDEHTRWRVVV